MTIQNTIGMCGNRLSTPDWERYFPALGDVSVVWGMVGMLAAQPTTTAIRLYLSRLQLGYTDAIAQLIAS
jgi:hypothetical protein